MVDVSAKLTHEHEITPQSNYVSVSHDGWCAWQPRFELSTVHCNVDVTWFPFDDQVCQLIFESWLLRDNELKITILRFMDVYKFYIPSDEWNLTCALFLYYTVVHKTQCSLFSTTR